MRGLVPSSLDARRRLAWLAAGTSYVVVLLGVFHQVWSPGEGGSMFFGWDCLREYWQDIVYPLVALGRGELQSLLRNGGVGVTSGFFFPPASKIPPGTDLHFAALTLLSNGGLGSITDVRVESVQ